MANISNLLQELRERIASSSSSGAASSGGEDPLEVKFRTVLPNLLHAYVNSSSTGFALLALLFSFLLNFVACSLVISLIFSFFLNTLKGEHFCMCFSGLFRLDEGFFFFINREEYVIFQINERK
jgi:hypothetical protein